MHAAAEIMSAAGVNNPAGQSGATMYTIICILLALFPLGHTILCLRFFFLHFFVIFALSSSPVLNPWSACVWLIGKVVGH